jgi:AcrR family transcriptional regulator
MNDHRDHGATEPSQRPPGPLGWDLPASIEAAWGVRDRPHKGPKPGLTLQRVVDAAVGVAESEGLAAVSMSRVATELGASTMSLYRYVAAKDELLDLMADAAAGPPPSPPDPAQSWRKGLSQWAWGLRGSYYRAPWSLHIPIRGLPVTPNQVGWFENGLASLAATGLSAEEKASVALLISTYTRSEAMINADLNAAVQASGMPPDEWMSYYGRLLTTLTDPQHFPAISKAVADGVFDKADPPDKEFGFGLERILDGIEVFVQARTAAGPTAADPGAA